MVRDVLLSRSTGTLRVRFRALSTLAKDINKNPLQCSEADLYAYLCKLREAKSAITKGGSILQACRLVSVLAGTNLKDEILASQRLQGAAYGPLDGTVGCPRSPFTLVQLKSLEHLVSTTEDFMNVVIGGQILFCVYSQSRWSDAMDL
eukprot:4896026-Amphidinium_carterae.1